MRTDQLRDHQPLQGLRGPGLCHQLPENAIEFNRAGKAVINHDLCISCGICHSNCPYHAIVYMPVPCEEACPVKAITKDERGVEHIDESKCIYCGKCINSCPFGAIFEVSQVFDVLQRLREEEKMVAVVAPAILGQYNAPTEKYMARSRPSASRT